jgi:hypothetical protein
VHDSLSRLHGLRGSPIVRIGAVFCILAVLVGGYQAAMALAAQPLSATTTEAQRRDLGWSRSYGFGTACASKLVLPQAEVLLVNAMVGPGEPRPNLTLDADVSHFAYPLRPRFVELQWDLSAPWSPRAGFDYIAVWQRSDLRSAAQQAAGATAAQTLAADSAMKLVCSYTNVQGDRGTIYAASASAVNAPLPEPSIPTETALPSPYGSPQTVLLAYLGLFGLWSIGALVLATVH